MDQKFFRSEQFYRKILIRNDDKSRPGSTGGHTGAVPPQLTACAPQAKIVLPQATTVPRRNK